MIVWVFVVILIIIVVIVISVHKSSNKSDNNKSVNKITQNNTIYANVAERPKRELCEVDQNVIIPNQNLIDNIIQYIEIVNSANNISMAIREEWMNLFIVAANSQGGINRKLQNRNMVNLEISYSFELRELNSYPQLKSYLEKWFREESDGGSYSSVKYVALLGYIDGDPDTFIAQLGKVISNEYPYVSFLESKYNTTDGQYVEKIDDGSDGLIMIDGQNSSFDRG